jgi:hypothetical protein
MDKAKFQNYLNSEEPKLVEKLHSLFQLKLHSDITEAEIQLFLDDESGLNASFWIYFDGKNKKIDKNDKSLFPGRSMEIISLDFSVIFDDSFDSEDKFDDLDLQADLLKKWFVEGWKKQNGEQYQIPVEIAVHDDFGDGNIIKLS